MGSKPDPPKPDPALERDLKMRERESKARLNARSRSSSGGLLEFLTTSTSGRGGMIDLNKILGVK